MSMKSWMKMAFAVCLCGVLAMGCRTKPRPTGGTDTIGNEPPVEPPLSERFEDGVRVTDTTFENVLFTYDSFQIAGAEIAKIEKAAAFMKENARVRLVAEGNCDERGSREYNMSLGEQRALAVRAHLIGLGIDAARIQTKSYGKEKPLEQGHSEAAWSKNRRVEFALYR